jgi:3-methyladenine DNA glycosylase Tag
MNDVGIVRNRAKIEATVNNARRMRDLVQEFGSFAAYVYNSSRSRDAGCFRVLSCWK